MSSLQQFDYDDFCARMGSNQALMNLVAQEFIREGSEIIALLDVAVEKSDCVQVKLLAHRLKGASAEMSAVTLSNEAKVLGEAAKSNDTQEVLNRLVVIREAYSIARKEIKLTLAL